MASIDAWLRLVLNNASVKLVQGVLSKALPTVTVFNDTQPLNTLAADIKPVQSQPLMSYDCILLFEKNIEDTLWHFEDMLTVPLSTKL